MRRQKFQYLKKARLAAIYSKGGGRYVTRKEPRK
jgi:hypothetical protein